MTQHSKFLGNHGATAQLLGISEQALWKAVKERGCPCLGRRGKETLYDWREVLPWRVADLMPGDEDQRQRLAAAQAEKIEMENRRRKGQLAEVSEVEQTWASFALAVRSRLLRLPTTVAAEIADPALRPAVQATTTRVVREALTELAAYDPEAVKS